MIKFYSDGQNRFISLVVRGLFSKLKHYEQKGSSLRRTAYFHEQVEKIYSEMMLSFQWETPAIITILYSTSHVRKDAQLWLSEKVAQQGDKLAFINIHKEKSSILEQVKKSDIKTTIFSLADFQRSKGADNASTYKYLNLHREFFIEQSIRLLIWLKDEELQKMTSFAPDFWAFRHLVIDLTKNRATPSRHALSQGIAILKFPWELPETDSKKALAYRENSLLSLPKVIETSTMRANLYGEIAGIYFQNEKFKEASAALQQGLEIIPAGHLEDLKGKFLLAKATLLLREGDSEQAELICRQITPASRSLTEHLILWGQSCRINGKNTEAKKYIAKALKKQPENLRAWNELGNIHLNLGHHAQSMEAYRKAFELFPDSRILINQAIALLSEGHLQDTKNLFENVQRTREIIEKNLDKTNPLFNELMEKLC